MSDDSPKTLAQRFFRTCLYVLGGLIALWLAIEFASRIWGWILLGLLAAVATIGLLWLGRRRRDRW